MASKTYANLTAVTTTADTDLVAVYPTGGPLKVIAWVNLVAKLATDLIPTFLRRDQNLADLNSAGVARNNLGLGNVAVLTTGTTSGTVAVLGTGGKTPISTLPGGYLAKSATYSAVLADNGKLIDCTGTFTLTLPSAGTVGETYSIDVRNSGTGTITVAPPSGLIDDASSVTVEPGSTRTIVTDATDYYTTPEGPQGWTLLSTQATTSGTSKIFQPPQSWAEIMFEFDGVAANTGASITMAVSSDGVSYSAAVTPIGATSGGVMGHIVMPHYSSTVCSVGVTIGADAAAPVMAVTNSAYSSQNLSVRTASGVKYVSFVPVLGEAYTAGAIRMYGR